MTVPFFQRVSTYDCCLVSFFIDDDMDLVNEDFGGLPPTEPSGGGGGGSDPEDDGDDDFDNDGSYGDEDEEEEESEAEGESELVVLDPDHVSSFFF